MAQAARAIIIKDGKILVMYRNKNGSEYYTLVGGQLAPGESAEQALAREVLEETGLTITSARFIYMEDHPEPYNQQYIYLCEIGPHQDIAIQEASEEAALNKEGVNIHKPLWIAIKGFERLPFRTPILQIAIVKALKKGFPTQPIRL